MRSQFGSAGKLFTILTGGGLWYNNNIDDTLLPVVKINDDDSLLSHWPSEDYRASDTTPECRFWNFSVQYDSSLCNHFTIGRSSSTPTRAHDRAMACAAAYGTECILSPEIGLAIPAAFLHEQNGARVRMQMLLGPRLLPWDVTSGDQPSIQHVRVAPPDGDGMTDTKTFLFNRSVRVEFLDGATRSMHTKELHGADAYCVQLLRAAFVADCWTKLD